MSLGDVAGVFSRYFIVGFVLPSFFALVALAQIVDDSFLPAVYRSADDGPRVLIIGGAAVFVGLVLLGLHYPILRLYEGYPLAARADGRYVGRLCKLLMRRQEKLFAAAKAACEDEVATPVARRTAKWRMDLRFPWDAEGLLLPTGFGNALRAFERHSRSRWGLNAVAAWPGIEMLRTPDEIEVHTDARGDVAFFVNGSLLAALGGLTLLADAVIGAHPAWYSAPLYAIPFVLAGALYVSAIGAVIRWGSAVRASMDIHRRELYEKVGLRKPKDFTDERNVIAPALNAALLRAEPIPDELAANTGAEPPQDPFLSRLLEVLGTPRER